MNREDTRPRRRPIVGVMGSGQVAERKRCEEVGRLIAHLGAHLLTGGGAGVMEAVSRAFTEVRPRTGLCLAVLPARPEDPWLAPPGYPNPYVEVAIRTHLPGRGSEGGTPRSRNAINVASSDALVILPGGAGTRSEAELAQEAGKPVLLWVDDPETWPAGASVVREAAELKHRLRGLLSAAEG